MIFYRSQDIFISKKMYQYFLSNLLTFNRLCVIIIISKIRFVNLDRKSRKLYLDTLPYGKGSKMQYGYCRISTKKQSIDRQIRNISSAFPDAYVC